MQEEVQKKILCIVKVRMLIDVHCPLLINKW